MVKNKQEWLESRKKLKERKKRGAKEDRASDEEAARLLANVDGAHETFRITSGGIEMLRKAE